MSKITMADGDTSQQKQDGQSEMRLVQSQTLRYVLIGLGTLSIMLGIIGIFLPVLPTAPFLLLAAACYARASERFYNKLVGNRHVGHHIRDWRASRGIPLRGKIMAVSMLAVSIGTSVIFFVPWLFLKIGMIVVGVCVAIYLILLPTCKPQSEVKGARGESSKQ